MAELDRLSFSLTFSFFPLVVSSNATPFDIAFSYLSLTIQAHEKLY
jgi:hypothetical protein